MPGPKSVSYLLAAAAIPLVLHFHLLPAVFAGLAVHVLTVSLARRLPNRWGGLTHKLALTVIVTGVMLTVFGIGFGLWSFVSGHHGMVALLAAVAETLENLKRTLPADIANVLPESVVDLREQVAAMLRDHGQKISAMGMAGFKTFAHVLLGMVVGGMTALHHFDGVERRPALVGFLLARTSALANAFYKVVFAQVKISALNTLLTAIYLAVILPLFDIQLPLLAILIPFTFVTGLLPVVGNLISNTVIVVISLGISTGVGIASLGFLVAIHKLEYFTNARIVGVEVQARAWELLCAMLVMEAFFGMAGLVAAPVVYAWLKAELRSSELI
jgi:predicted PurR-regulated permease PerM